MACNRLWSRPDISPKNGCRIPHCSMGRDVNDTTSKLLADQARGAIKDSMLDKVSDWFFPGEEP